MAGAQRVLLGELGAVVVELERAAALEDDEELVLAAVPVGRAVEPAGRDDVERQRFARANQDLYDVSVAIGRLLALMFPAVMLVLNVSSVAVLWFGASRIERTVGSSGTSGCVLTRMSRRKLQVA